MKTIYFLRFRDFSICSLTACLLTLAGCTAPHEDVDLILNSGISEATVGVNFINAKTGESIGMGGSSSDQVTVQIHGPGASLVVASDGSTEFICDQGFLSLGLIYGVVPSESNPITFRVVASAPGYLKSSQQVTLYKLGGEALSIPMVELEQLPDGVAAVSGSLITNGSGAESEVIFNSGNPQTVFEQTSATVTIPQGTIMKNAAGSALVGTIDLTLAYFNNLDESSIAAFPGGFATQTASDGDVVFTTGGFVSLEMAKGSSPVSTFETPIQLTIEVPNGTLNHEGNPIGDGTVVPIWSYNTTTGEWNQEPPAVANTNGSTGKIEVNFPVTHLSYWNLDWFGSACQLGATINVTVACSISNYVYTRVKNANTGALISEGLRNMSSGSFRLLYAPLGAPLLIQVFESSVSSTVIGSVSIPNGCSGTYNLTIDSPSPQNEVEIQVNLRCPNRPNFIFRPTLPLWAKVVGGSWTYIGQMVNGNFSTCALTIGVTYEFATQYDGIFYVSPTSHTVTQSTYIFERELTEAACGEI